MDFFFVFFFTVRSMKGKLRREMINYSEIWSGYAFGGSFESGVDLG